MSLYTRLLRPLLFRRDAEEAHQRAVRACERVGRHPLLLELIRRQHAFEDPRLAVEPAGLRMANPIGLAAGWDKDARAVEVLAALGYGHMEIGSVSALPSEGNPKPRLFRVPDERALIVNYGLPNEGAEVIAERLRQVRTTTPVGVNIVKTNLHRGETEEEILADYEASVRQLKDRGAYLTLNLSCPNTEGGKDYFAEPAHVGRLLERLRDVELAKPLFLKITPLGGDAYLDGLLEAIDPFGFVFGFLFNLPPGKPQDWRPDVDLANMPGAVAGRPVAALLKERTRAMYRRMDRGRYCLIGGGGIFTADDAWRRMQAGASAVQIYTAMIYEGPGIVKRINRGLVERMVGVGVWGIGEVVGSLPQ